MKKLFLSVLMAFAFTCSLHAQDVSFTIVKTDGISSTYTMSSDAKIYYSDTQLFLDNNGETVSYNLSDLRKAYFSTNENVDEVENRQFDIHPNPVKDVLRIAGLTDKQIVTIHSIDGKTVKRIAVNDSAEINVSDLKSGLYIIGVGNKYSKFIKL